MARHIRGTGRVFRRPRSPYYWIAYYHRGTEQRESTGLTDRAKAEKLLRERTRTAGTPNFTGASEYRVTFAQLAERYLRDYRVNGRRSLDDAERIVKRLGEHFGADRALDITTGRIEAYTDQRLAAGAAKATVNRVLAALRRMFSLALKSKDRDTRLTSRPHIPMLDESDNVREGFFEPEDFEAVRAHLPADVADAAAFAYYSGWRRGEVLSLEWRDVRLETRDGVVVGGTIQLRRARSKNKRGRVLVLRADLLEVLAHRAAVRRLDCVHVFHRAGRPLRDFRTTWRKACEAAGLPGRLFHDMRRSAIRNMVRAGVPENIAMQVSGHKTRSTFDRYDITSEKDIADAMDLSAAYVARRRAESTPRVVARLPRNTDTTRTLDGSTAVRPRAVTS